MPKVDDSLVNINKLDLKMGKIDKSFLLSSRRVAGSSGNRNYYSSARDRRIYETIQSRSNKFNRDSQNYR